MRKIPFAGIELTSQRVRGLRGTSELPGRPVQIGNVDELGYYASNQRQKKREAEEADKVEVAPGVTVASLRRFRTALIGPTQGLPKRRRLCR